MEIVLVLTSVVFSSMLGLEIMKYMEVKQVLTDDDAVSSTDLKNPLNLKLRRSLKGIWILSLSLMILFLIAVVMKANLIAPSEIDLLYHSL